MVKTSHNDKKELEFIRRTDLEIVNQATIWIEIPLIKSNNLLIAGGYRQWQLPKSSNIANLGSPNNKKKVGWIYIQI